MLVASLPRSRRQAEDTRLQVHSLSDLGVDSSEAITFDFVAAHSVIVGQTLSRKLLALIRISK